MSLPDSWISRCNGLPSGRQYAEDAKRIFLAGADPWLIAHASAHGHTVVTHEVHVDGEKRKVRIPTVCRALNVPCIRTFEMLHTERVRFVLGGDKK